MLISNLIFILVLFIVMYCMPAAISHYEGCCFGEVIPSWLCIFCLIEKIAGKNV